MVTPVFFWDAGSVVTGELAAGARPSSWGQSAKKKFAVTLFLHVRYKIKF